MSSNEKTALQTLCTERYQHWLEKVPAGDPMHQELVSIAGNAAEITDRFYQEIVFGTAGLRGICGAGTNRMNVYTVGRATQGIADYINQYRHGTLPSSAAAVQPFPADKADGVVIGYDCRYHSQEFSELAAEILAANGIRVYLFPSMRPTPELSFAIRRLHALSGINMTASHNPKEYNGYKVYWQDGAQISGEVSDGMQQAITRLDLFDVFPRMPLEEARAKGLVVMLHGCFDAYHSAETDKSIPKKAEAAGKAPGKAMADLPVQAGEASSVLKNVSPSAPDTKADAADLDRAYLDYVATMRLRPDSELDLAVPIVYTPLNGAGSIPMRCAAAERGFSSFTLVPEQADPDPEFTTVGYPNPEDPKAFALAEKLGKQKAARLIIATDPDSDRMAIEIPTAQAAPAAVGAADPAAASGGHALSPSETGFVPLDGNQTGALIIAYRAQSMQEAGTLPKNACMIKSIVTGDMGRAICEHYGISVFEALTGFKNICGRIPELQEKGYTYFFGYEESIGCAPGEAVRDKDGIAAGMILSEMAAWLQRQGKTIADYLEELYHQYGYYAQKQISIVLKGQEGAQRIQRMMRAFRENTPGQFAAAAGGTEADGTAAVFPVSKVVDYLHGYEDIPASNVLKFIIDEQTWFAVRPSGTEPKIKFYYYTVSDSMAHSRQTIQELSDAVSAWADSIA